MSRRRVRHEGCGSRPLSHGFAVTTCPPSCQPIPGHCRGRQSGHFLEIASLLPPLAALRRFPLTQGSQQKSLPCVRGGGAKRRKGCSVRVTDCHGAVRPRNDRFLQEGSGRRPGAFFAKNAGLWRPFGFFMSTRKIMQLFRRFSVYITMWKTMWIMCKTLCGRLILWGCVFVIRKGTA